MGTRADFYVGRGVEAEWLGSIAWDGYPDGITPDLLAATNEPDFREQVVGFLAARDDHTLPEQGWPWPWDDSNITDFAYAFDGGKVWTCCFGGAWWPAIEPPPEGDEHVLHQQVFPNMAGRRNLARGSVRSGMMTVSTGPDGTTIS